MKDIYWVALSATLFIALMFTLGATPSDHCPQSRLNAAAEAGADLLYKQLEQEGYLK